jgi:hypothetical protein
MKLKLELCIDEDGVVSKEERTLESTEWLDKDSLWQLFQITESRIIENRNKFLNQTQ